MTDEIQGEQLREKIELFDAGESSTDAVIGKIIGGHYLIEEKLGSGGMSDVYRAKHTILDDRVAVKFLGSSQARDPQALARFKKEAKTATTLTHANLAGLKDFGVTEDGVPYLVMELVKGESLSELIRSQGKLKDNEAINIAVQLCDAIGYAHKNGILHRDLKPSNVMVFQNAQGELTCKVIDFGIAKVLDTEGQTQATLTQTGEIMGSPAYMSPEQCQGQSLDKRSDIYSLGCVIFEMLNGRPPFSADTALGLVMKHMNETPPPFSNKKVSPHLASVVYRCLEKDPKTRYQTVDELRLDLELVSRGEKPLKGRSVFALTPKQRYKLTLQVVTVVSLLIAGWIAYKLNTMTPLEEMNLKVTLNPKNPDGYIMRGRLLSRLGENRTAIADFNKAISLNPNDVMSYVWLSAAESDLGAYGQGLTDADKAIKMAPAVHQGYLHKAVALIGLGRYDEAVKECTSALAMNPKNLYNNNSRALLNRSIAYTYMGKFEEALADARQVVILKPDDAGAYNQVSSSLMTLGRYEEALSSSDDAIRLSPNSPVFLVRKANALVCLKKSYGDAIQLCTRALEIYEPDSRSYAVRGKAYIGSGQTELGARDIKRALQLNPKEPLAIEAAGELKKTGS